MPLALLSVFLMRSVVFDLPQMRLVGLEPTAYGLKDRRGRHALNVSFGTTTPVGRANLLAKGVCGFVQLLQPGVSAPGSGRGPTCRACGVGGPRVARTAVAPVGRIGHVMGTNLRGVRWAVLPEGLDSDDLAASLRRLFPEYIIPGDATIVGVLLHSNRFPLTPPGASMPTLHPREERSRTARPGGSTGD